METTSYPSPASARFGPVDPFDSSSGFGADSEGEYEVTFSWDVEPDSDFYAVELEAGDILGATVRAGATHVTVYHPSGEMAVGSSADASYIHPDVSPLPRTGNSSLTFVAAESGTYTIAVDGGSGEYEMELGVFRPLLESEPRGTKQILFIDFDGASINAQEIYGFGNPEADLSPLSAFLPRWGLSGDDEHAVIQSVMETVHENLRDAGLLGFNGERATDGTDGHFDIEVVSSLESRDALGFPKDLFGQPHVSRVIVGGTIAEFGIETIGLAQSIDTGNFETESTGVVLLDLLSGRASSSSSLNRFALDPSATMIDLLGTGLGNIVTHEAGHFFGNWHTENENSETNIMDQGGLLTNTVGVGPDRVFGSEDDVDVDLGIDAYDPDEIFEGHEDTLNAIAFGLSTGKVDTGLRVIRTSPSVGSQIDARPLEFIVSTMDDVDDAMAIDAADFTVNGVPADGYFLFSPREIMFYYQDSPVTTPGIQQMNLREGAILRHSDNSPLAAFSAEFGFDDLAMNVIEVTPAEETRFALPFSISGTTEVTVKTNEPYAPASVGLDDLFLNEGHVASFSMVDETTISYQLSGLKSEGELVVTMHDGSLTDVGGNLATGFRRSYTTEIGTIAFAPPSGLIGPAGSRVYQPTMSGTIAPGDSDVFSIVLDPGHAINIVLESGKELIGRVDVYSDKSFPASQTATVPGQVLALPVYIENTSYETAEYLIQVSGEDESSGEYTLRLLLNAVVENETEFEIVNNLAETAQPIDLDLLPTNLESRSPSSVIGSLVGPNVRTEDFEAAELGADWTTYSSSEQGRIRLTDVIGTTSGQFALVMDVSEVEVATLNEAIWTVDVSEIESPVLSFSHIRYGDETTLFTGGDFEGHFDADGVAISVDGVQWHPVFNPPRMENRTWTRYFVNLGEAAERAGISLDESLQIKFQQFDNFPLEFDGRGWDDISIGNFDDADWYSFELKQGQTITLATANHGQGHLDLDLLDSTGSVVDAGVFKTIRNGSFESGDFQDWQVELDGGTERPWFVVKAGAGGNLGIEQTSPPDGMFGAANAFDGDGPIEYRLFQDITLPTGTSKIDLSWQHRIQWLFYENNSPARTFAVQLRDPSTNEILETIYDFTTGPENEAPQGDTGWQTITKDLAHHAGSMVRLYFVESIPENNSGVGQFELDNVSIDIGLRQSENVDDVVDQFLVPTDGTYYARVSGTPGLEYSLVAARNAAFDIEPNNDLASAQTVRPILQRGEYAALGYLDGPTDRDFYQIDVRHGKLTVTTATPSIGPGDFRNSLDPLVRIYNRRGELVAEKYDAVDSDQGRNAKLVFDVPMDDAGVYFIEIATNGEGANGLGEYQINIEAGVLTEIPRVITDSTRSTQNRLNDFDSRI